MVKNAFGGFFQHVPQAFPRGAKYPVAIVLAARSSYKEYADQLARIPAMDYAAARRNMVDCQILPNNVTDPRVVDAMSELPREDFVATRLKGVAYVDEALPLGSGRYLMEPMVVGRLLDAAELKTEDVVLVVGCASGYLPAILAKIVSTVVALEPDKALAERAEATFSTLGLDNIAVVSGPLADGYAKQGPYDAIIFDGAVSEVPAAISKQLAEGGRLVAVVNGADGVGRARLILRYGDVVSGRYLFDAGTPMLPGFEREAAFTF
jgi:protein-L-isoaspartate(D-aspartate) O-methyltransferase